MGEVNIISKVKIALVPDRLASYRYTVFRKLSESSKNGFHLEILADDKEDVAGLKILDSAYCDNDYQNGGISWSVIKNVTWRNICFWQRGLLNRVAFGDYDMFVLWGEMNRLSTWLAAIIAKLRGKHVVFWSHGIYGNEGSFKMRLRLLFYKLSDAMLLYSDYAKTLMENRGFRGRDLYVIKNSLDCSVQNKLFNDALKSGQAFSSPKKGERQKTLLFIGRLEPQKSLGMLIDALAVLSEAMEGGVNLLIVGDGSEMSRLVELVDKLNLVDRVVFYGACYDDAELAPLIMGADICVSPGEVGLTAMHSLVFGTPVVTHDDFSEQMPEFEVIRPSVSGAFFKYGDTEDLCRVIIDVFQMLEDGLITADSCRRSVLENYTAEYQQAICSKMVGEVIVAPK